MGLFPPVYRFGKLIILQPHVFRWVDGSRRFEVALCAPHIMAAQLEEAKVSRAILRFVVTLFFGGEMVMVISCDPCDKKRRIGYLSYLGGQRVFQQKGLFGDISGEFYRILPWDSSPLHFHHHFLEIFLHVFQPPQVNLRKLQPVWVILLPLLGVYYNSLT